MSTFRMLPPPAVGQQTVTTNGRTYTAAPGAVVDVVDFDAAVLGANGWTKVALSGPTTSRPSPNPNAGPPYSATRGLHFYDTTISKWIIFDGQTWRSPVDGSSV
jgi:hypothetical protein